MNASVTRNSGDTSSTHIIDDVLNSVRIIVLANTSRTSAASMTLISPMTTSSTASSQCGIARGVTPPCSVGRAVVVVANARVCGIADLLRNAAVAPLRNSAGASGAAGAHVSSAVTLKKADFFEGPQ